MKTTLSFILCAALLAPAVSFAQTRIPHGTTVTGTWTKSGSPYIIQGEAVVPIDQMLAIEPGVEVRFETGEQRTYMEGADVGILRVSGKLLAKGTAQAPIRFTRDDAEGNWGSVYCDADGSAFEYCVFEYGYHVRGIAHEDNATAALSFYAAKGLVRNCIFRSNGWASVNAKAESAVSVKNCVFDGNTYALESNSSSKVSAKQCIFTNNETNFYLSGEGKVTLKTCLVDSNEGWDSGVEYSNTVIWGDDPGYQDPERGNYRLKPGSVAKKGKMGVVY